MKTRISFDLDEVLFVNPDTHETEDKLKFPLYLRYKERLRKGTKYLINELQARDFEVWVYTSSFRSVTYIKMLFACYGIHFDNIINGAKHREEIQSKRNYARPSKMPGYYRISLHVDDEASVAANGKALGFNVFTLCAPDPDWCEKILDTADTIRKREQKMLNQ